MPGEPTEVMGLPTWGRPGVDPRLFATKTLAGELMNTLPYPKSLRILTLLLIVLAVVSLITPFISGIGFNPTGRQPGTMPPTDNARPEGGNVPQGGLPGSGNVPQRSGGMAFNLFGLTRALGLGVQMMPYVNYGAGLLGAGLAGLAAFWVHQRKKAGLNLALALGIVFLLGALPAILGGLRFANALSTARYALNLLSILASVGILALSILPSVRDEVEG